MAEVQLAANQYGKAENRVVRVTRDTDRHEVADLNVTSQLRGDFAAAHIDGDNSHVVATDTQKNTIFAFAKDGIESPEAFLLRLADHFTGEFDWVSGGRWAADQYGWSRINDHDHAFYRGAPEVRTTVLVRDNGTDTLLSGFFGLTVMKTTQSGFVGYPEGQVHDPAGDRGPDPGHRHQHEVALQHHRPRLQRGLRQRQAGHPDHVLPGLLQGPAAGSVQDGRRRSSTPTTRSTRSSSPARTSTTSCPTCPSAGWRTRGRCSTPPIGRTV